MPLLTLFTAPKPFTDPHIRIIQHNTLRNWQALGDDIEVIVIGDEPGIAETCHELGIRHLKHVRCNEHGTPLISSIFDQGRGVNNSPILAYANADILFLPDLLSAVHMLQAGPQKFLAVGQRWDIDIKKPFRFTTGWDVELRDLIEQAGKLHRQTGSDYFIYPRHCSWELPDFAVGRAGWDNWMIYRARWQGWPVINLTGAVTVVHQNHDYGHLPGGVVHYRQPETDVNVRIGGGRRTIFTLKDATHVFEAGALKRKRMHWRTFWREVEIFPLVRLHSRSLGYLFFAIFHPIQAFNEVRGWLAYKLRH